MANALKERKFRKTIKDIKTLKIQGARNIAKAAIKAYSLKPTKEAEKQLINARPTEPMLANALKYYEKNNKEKTLKHFDFSQEKINENVLKILNKKNQVIFTHCHSTNVVNALINAKKKGKKFEVYNTETRPLYQGRITTKRLKKAKIPVTSFVDSAAKVALTKEQGTKKVDFVFLGSDAILENGVINKIGSGMFAEIAYNNKIPVYIIADSWKFTKQVKLEERQFQEIWKNRPEKVKIRNPAFEKIDKKHIKRIVSELGILTLNQFIKEFKKNPYDF